MKIIVLLITVMIILPPSSFATSKNFYSIEPDVDNFFAISSQDYENKIQHFVTASISNGNITKFDFSPDSDVMIHVSMHDDGLLYVNIPKSIMYLADHNCNSDAFVLVDGEEVLNVFEQIVRSENVFRPEKDVKSWAIETPRDSKQVEILFAFIIPDFEYSYAFGQRCMMLEKGEVMKPLVQKKLGLELHQIICEDGLELTYKKESRPACVTEDTFLVLFERGWQPRLFLPQHIALPESGQTNYKTVGDMKITDVVNHPESGIAEIFIDSKSKSNLVMRLERDFIGTPLQEGNSSPGYSILVDGKDVKFREPGERNSYSIYFQLNVPSGTEKIEVVPDK